MAKAGRPPKEFTEEQIRRIDELAEAQCKDFTIAEELGVEIDTFKRHFANRTQEKRAIGKNRVMLAQYQGCLVNGTGGMSERVWWGKQHLKQTDKQAIEHDVSDELGDLLREINGTRVLPTD